MLSPVLFIVIYQVLLHSHKFFYQKTYLPKTYFLSNCRELYQATEIC